MLSVVIGGERDVAQPHDQQKLIHILFRTLLGRLPWE